MFTPWFHTHIVPKRQNYFFPQTSPHKEVNFCYNNPSANYTRGRSHSPLLAEDDVTTKKQLTQYRGLAAFLFANTKKRERPYRPLSSCLEGLLILQGLQHLKELHLLFVSKVLNEFSCVLFVHGNILLIKCVVVLWDKCVLRETL